MIQTICGTGIRVSELQHITVDENGQLSAADGGLVTDNTFTATVSASAVRGKYYLVVKRGDKYERILLKVVAAATA